jgi:hypothetical protein
MSILIVILTLITVGLVTKKIQNGFKAIPKSTVYQWFGSGFWFSIDDIFKYHFLPVLLMSTFNWFWENVDWFYRITQPYASMYNPAPATSSLLLDYSSSASVAVAIKAVKNGHWRVALFSVISLCSVIPPILAGGVVQLTLVSDTTYSYVVLEAPFLVLFVVLILYLGLLVIARPTPAYRLPRTVRSFSDVLSYCHSSRILDDLAADGKPIFSAQEPDESRVHLESRIHLAKKSYQFGMYLGNDGERHMGFDVDDRINDNGQHERVETFYPGRGIRGLWFTIWFRNPRKWVSED